MRPTGGVFFFEQTSFFEGRLELEDCICFNRNSFKSNRIQAAGENCRKSAATAARAPD